MAHVLWTLAGAGILAIIILIAWAIDQSQIGTAIFAAGCVIFGCWAVGFAMREIVARW